MEKVFHFDSPQEVYEADACVISCFDARFDTAIRKFLKRRGIALFDQIKIPGSAKALAAPDCEGDRDFVLRMVRTMDEEGFGSCTNHFECEAACPKEISVEWIARLYRDYMRATLTRPADTGRGEGGVG